MVSYSSMSSTPRFFAKAYHLSKCGGGGSLYRLRYSATASLKERDWRARTVLKLPSDSTTSWWIGWRSELAGRSGWFSSCAWWPWKMEVADSSRARGRRRSRMVSPAMAIRQTRERNFRDLIMPWTWPLLGSVEFMHGPGWVTEAPHTCCSERRALWWVMRGQACSLCARCPRLIQN